MKQVKWRPLLTSVLLAQLAGQIASLLAGRISAVYATMTLPPFAPPAALFRPVWIILYALMGLAAYRIWVAEGAGRREALRLYGVQLILNALWPMLFFRLGSPLIALVAILVLAALIFLTFRRFNAIDRPAGRLMLPYLIWVLYAVYLVIGHLVLR